MDLGLKGKRALVMSSSRGLGLGIARVLAEEGADVLLSGRSEDRLAAEAAAINAKGQGRAHWVGCDLAATMPPTRWRGRWPTRWARRISLSPTPAGRRRARWSRLT
ncbi:MAG: SDR family NAD(P)-dependent oxidoreductase [Defluviimonas denitrificans]